MENAGSLKSWIFESYRFVYFFRKGYSHLQYPKKIKIKKNKSQKKKYRFIRSPQGKSHSYTASSPNVAKALFFFFYLSTRAKISIPFSRNE